MTREHLIGGTDAADLLGIGRTSPTTLYLRLRGEIPDDFEGNEATDAGRLFEDHVAVPAIRKKFGVELVRPSEMTLVLPDEPRIGASFDFEMPPDHLAEVKLTGSRRMWGENLDTLPPIVAAQTQFQMAVARAAKRIVPVVHVYATFVPGFIMEDFPVEEDLEVGEALLGAARDMLRRVDKGEPPDPQTAEDARRVFLGLRGVNHLCSDEEISLIEQLRQAKDARKVCEEQEKAILDALLPAFGSATEIVNPHNGEVLATWRPNKSFDRVRFETDLPELAQQYRKVGIDLTRLRKDHPQTAKDYTSTLDNPVEAVRPFKISKQKVQ